MQVVTIVGARPQFIKAAAVSRAVRRHGGVAELIVHTGQHYDHGMSQVFFDELGIPAPDWNLEVVAESHGAMTGRMLEAVEDVLTTVRPDCVLVYGDTNSTLAGALAAAKLRIPVAHVEAGLRSFNRRMPEEQNRVLTDHLADLLFCPTHRAVEQLAREGITRGVKPVGDVMYDLALFYAERARARVPLDEWGVTSGSYALCTVHRQENTREPRRLAAILAALRELAQELPVLLPLHPGTARWVEALGDPQALRGLDVRPPLSYLQMTRLESEAAIVLTDSGGVQKEAFFHGVPCITLREETEWMETVEAGWNRLAGADPDAILQAWREMDSLTGAPEGRPYGDGHAAEHVVEELTACL